ncbi:MAG: hypothetical protein HY553_07485 [Elusimicrobia bacterium]|nr:hypothetical protein [Elusimicrobiota bacterium]
MKRLAAFLAPFLVAVAAHAGDPLADADRSLRAAARATAAGFAARSAAVAAPAPQPATAADYCVLSNDTGAEGMPDFRVFTCTNGVKIASMRRWCWTGRCSAGFTEDAMAVLRGKGYELVGAYLQRGRTETWAGQRVFQRAGLSKATREQHCLAQRWVHRGKAKYSVDCADGAVIALDVDEPNDGTAAIEAYLANRGCELVGRFELDDDHYGPLLFRQRASR